MVLWIIVGTVALLLSVFAGWAVYARASARPPLERWIAAALPAAFIVAAVKIASVLRLAPCSVWNDVRLARSISLLHGYRLYYDQQDNAPIIGTMHLPVSHLIYTIVAGFGDPDTALRAALALTFALVAAPAAWLCFTRRGRGHAVGHASPPAHAIELHGTGGEHAGLPTTGRDRILSAACLAALLFVMMNTRAYYAVLMIHVDGAAIGFATVAAGMLYLRREISNRALLVSALAAVLCAFCKQTFLAVPFGLALFVLISEGAKKFVRYLVFLAACAVVIGALIIAFLGPLPSILFNVFILSTERPAKVLWPVAAEGYNILRADVLPAVCCLLFFGIYAASRQRRWRPLFQENRWLVFVVVAGTLLPAVVVAWLTVGGSRNHLGTLIYLLFVAAVLAIRDAAEDPGVTAAMRMAAWCMLAGLIVVNADRLPWKMGWTTDVSSCATHVASNYERNHPGKAYFPKNPLPALMLEGKLYHDDYALLEREIAGYPVTEQQLRAHIPASAEEIAFPADEPVRADGMRRHLAGYQPAIDPELPGWLVFRRPPPPEAIQAERPTNLPPGPDSK